ncbi:MAG: ADP-ribosylglycohydrolase family protein [Bacilli bacterium]|jgi:ADP-ribosylglycohydrolase
MTEKNMLMYGATIGDIVGSVYEFSNCVEEKPQSEDFALFPENAGFTDDTVMTAAIAYALLNHLDVGKTMRAFYSKYPLPKGGYGGRFLRWLDNPDMGPFYSFGNGAGMRVSSVAYFASSFDECNNLAVKVTEITHNHPEGIKAACTIASLIYLSLHGKNKEYLKSFANQKYNLNFHYEELHQNYQMDVTCQGSVPVAIFAFLTSMSFEDCLRRVNYIGGDTDTIGAMACAIASAFYKDIPDNIIKETKKRLPKEFIKIFESVPILF